MAVIIQVRRDTAANWTSEDPTLASGEIGYETDTGKIKVGNGASAWTALPYRIAAGTLAVVLKVVAKDVVVEQGDDQMRFTIPAELNGFNLVSVGAHVYTVDGASNVITIDIYNYTDTVDMLSTPITIDAGEKDSKDAATPAVIDTGNDDVVEGDEIGVDVTGYAGDTAKELEVRLGFRIP